LWQRTQDTKQDEWAGWKLPTSDNPYIPDSEIEAARAGLPERIFQQEYLADFIEDGGGVFRRVAEAATATPVDTGVSGRQYVIGADWARSNDYTVFTVIDTGTNEVVYVDRFNQIDYLIQATRLQALNSRFQPYTIIVEQNNVGVPFIEMLYRLNLPVQPFTTTNATKTQAIDALALAFERGEIRIPNDAVLIAELQAYEMERLPSGLMRYSAPAGMHDDTVMSLALAWQGRGESGNLLLFGG
jgi:phage FluMu gp28-like protein